MSARCFRQQDGDLFIGIAGATVGDEILIAKEDLNSLLSVVMCAARNTADPEIQDLARKITRAWLP
ncbi:MAG TPA: hypothetical protein VJU58_13670 [Microbacterium sp.]|nr:hypothetical protein [Microbacterium sp.]